ncbi:four helix bundle protein [Patescibacteria group bacterium]|nr:MAG: four helix bundle protein [Patescibacteria group bacterium]
MKILKNNFGFLFRDWNLYENARAYRKNMNNILRAFPKEEQFALTDQTRRAILSIVLNIAESSNKNMDKDSRVYINRAQCSLDEVVACFDCAKDEEYISDRQHQEILEKSQNLAKQLNGFNKYLSNTNKPKLGIKDNGLGITKGFTLVELILYVALVGILLTAGAIFAGDVILGSIKGRVRAKVQSEARFAVEKMRQEIVKGKSLEAIQNSVWIVNGSVNNIQKFNAITGAKDTSVGSLGDISTGSLVGHGIAYDPVQNAVWITGWGSPSTQKYNAGTGAQIGGNISGGGLRLAYDPKQNAVWSVGGNSLIKINAANGSVITNDTSTANRRTAAYDSDSNAVWVTDLDNNRLQKYNASNGSLMMNVSTDNFPKGVAYDIRQNAVWVANNNNPGSVQKFNTSGVLQLTINVPDAYVLAYDPKQNAVWVAACAYDKIYKIDAVAGALLGTYNTGDCPHGIVYDHVQNAVWVSNTGFPSSLQKFDAATGNMMISTVSALATYEAETMTHNIGAAITDGWNIWSTNNYIDGDIYTSSPFNFPSAGEYLFQVRAYGSSAASVWPMMNIKIDGSIVASATVDSSSWKTYFLRGNVSAGDHTVGIYFSNDACCTPPLFEDRNLYIDKLAITSGDSVASSGAASVAYAFNCRFLLGDDATRVSFSVNGDGKTTSLHTLQTCSKSGLGCGPSDAWSDLSSPDTEVTNFTCTNISSGTSLGEEAVKIDLTLKNKNPGGKKEFDAEATIETSISLRL